MSLLVEELRPKNLRSIFGQPEAVQQMIQQMKNPDEMTHLLMAGPPGCGKTSCAVAWAQESYPKEQIKDWLKMINLSVSRETKDILQHIHSACKQKFPKAEKGRPTKGLLICDEADSLNSEGQEILRRCIERQGEKWWFVLIMNNPTRINPTLRSITKLIRFHPCNDAVKQISGLCERYDIQIKEDELKLMDATFHSDLRKMINAVQGLNLIHVRQEWQLNMEKAQRKLKGCMEEPTQERMREFVVSCGNDIRIIDVIMRTLRIGPENEQVIQFLETTLRSGNLLPHVAILIHSLRKSQ